MKQDHKRKINGIRDERAKHRGREGRDGENVGRPIVYGVLPVMEALRANPRRIEKIIVAAGSKEHRLSKIMELARASGVSVQRGPGADLARLTPPGANHQGVAAMVAASNYFPADELLDEVGDQALLVILDGVEDPRNLGAILRSAECAGADGVIIPERRASGLTDAAAKSSAGAVEHIRVAKTANINRFIADLKEKNVWVVGADAAAGIDYTEWDWTRASALVLGGEGNGLHRLVAENCDVLVKIPMYGKINSLNVSVAAGVILFEARRQRSAGRVQEK
ncbi:MAG TPA: 23S rRNA (guanosine(2251)-2'-O)-methyltransferase RlmB [Blastocatellia bacterium]|nr:23S rRNA (guanosine(2251)-2'-O)-methyltransferase RlmB [Blastocatellia bacterium]